MRKNASVILSIGVIIFLFAGCNKFKDHWYPFFPHPKKDFSLCRITQIHQSAGPLVRDRTGNFYYSDNGNLDSVVFDDRGIVHYWKYNSQNELLEYRDAFHHDITDFITLHKYASANGRVVRDTTWLEGASGYIVQVWSLEYDSRGRVIRETGIRIDDEAPGEVLPERVYTYNEQGNLANGGVYDNEVNFLRTNRVLQFVHRNYSVNNQSVFVLGYNSYHLPVGFRIINDGSFLKGEMPLEISYSCVAIPGIGNYKDECSIDHVKQLSGTTTLDGYFYYTPGGLPLSVQYIQSDFNSESNVHQFQYDRYNKLIGYQIVNGIYAFTRHSYGYSGNRITLDTLYSDLGEQFLQVSTLHYDNEGRIIKEDIEVLERNFAPVSELSTKEYAYDSRGNLVSPLATSYDNKVSYLRTEPLWMFIHRNYSLNNPQGVTQYNNKDLPLGFSDNVFGFLGFEEPLEIEYVCIERTRPGRK